MAHNNWIGVKWVEPHLREVQSTAAKNQEKTLYKLNQ